MDHPLIGDLSKASATVFHIGIATSKDSKLSKDSKNQVSRLDDNYKWLLYVFFLFWNFEVAYTQTTRTTKDSVGVQQ